MVLLSRGTRERAGHRPDWGVDGYHIGDRTREGRARGRASTGGGRDARRHILALRGGVTNLVTERATVEIDDRQPRLDESSDQSSRFWFPGGQCIMTP